MAGEPLEDFRRSVRERVEADEHALGWEPSTLAEQLQAIREIETDELEDGPE